MKRWFESNEGLWGGSPVVPSDSQGNVVVFDMGSVERKETVGEGGEGWVERAISELEKRCGVKLELQSPQHPLPLPPPLL